MIQGNWASLSFLSPIGQLFLKENNLFIVYFHDTEISLLLLLFFFCAGMGIIIEFCCCLGEIITTTFKYLIGNVILHRSSF